MSILVDAPKGQKLKVSWSEFGNTWTRFAEYESRKNLAADLCAMDCGDEAKHLILSDAQTKFSWQLEFNLELLVKLQLLDGPEPPYTGPVGACS